MSKMAEKIERESRTRMLQAWKAARDATDAWHVAKVRLAEVHLENAQKLMEELTGSARVAERIDLDELAAEWSSMRESKPKEEVLDTSKGAE